MIETSLSHSFGMFREVTVKTVKLGNHHFILNKEKGFVLLSA
jgi:hypothetical protein